MDAILLALLAIELCLLAVNSFNTALQGLQGEEAGSDPSKRSDTPEALSAGPSVPIHWFKSQQQSTQRNQGRPKHKQRAVDADHSASVTEAVPNMQPLQSWCKVAVAIPVANRPTVNMQSLVERVLRSYQKEMKRKHSECSYSFALYDVQLNPRASTQLNGTALQQAAGAPNEFVLVRSGVDEVHRESGIAKLEGEEKHKRDIRFVLTDLLERRIPQWQPSHIMLAEDDFEVCTFGLLELESALKLGNAKPSVREATLTLISFGLNGMVVRARDVHGLLVHIANNRFNQRPIDWTLWDHFIDGSYWQQREQKEGKQLRVHAWHRNLFRHLGSGAASTVGHFHPETDYACEVPMTEPNHWHELAYRESECTAGTTLQPLWPCDVYGTASEAQLPPHYTL